MKQTLEFRQCGKSSLIFVSGNYPITNSDAQLLADAGVTDPRQIKEMLHKVGYARLIRSQGNEK